MNQRPPGYEPDELPTALPRNDGAHSMGRSATCQGRRGEVWDADASSLRKRACRRAGTGRNSPSGEALRLCRWGGPGIGRLARGGRAGLRGQTREAGGWWRWAPAHRDSAGRCVASRQALKQARSRAARRPSQRTNGAFRHCARLPPGTARFGGRPPALRRSRGLPATLHSNPTISRSDRLTRLSWLIPAR